MTKAIAQTYNVAHEYGIKLTWSFLAVSIFLIAMYGVNLYKVISNSMALESVQKQMVAKTSSVDGLDYKYLELASKITPDNLKEYGLTQTKVSTFISRSASLGVVASGHEL